MYLDITGELPNGKYDTVIPTIDEDPTIPFIVWTPTGPYLQCTSNELVIESFVKNVTTKFPSMHVSGLTIQNTSERGFCEDIITAMDRSNCVGIIHWLSPISELTMTRDMLTDVAEGTSRILDICVKKDFTVWKAIEGTNKHTGFLIVPKENTNKHTYNVSLGGLGLIVHRHHDNALQHSKIIEKAGLISDQKGELQIGSITKNNQYDYMAFILRILNRRKAHGIWVWNNKGDGYFMPKNKVFQLISNNWLGERIS